MPSEIHLTYNFLDLKAENSDLGYLETCEFEDDLGKNARAFNAAQGQKNVTWKCKFPFLLIFLDNDNYLHFDLPKGVNPFYYWDQTTQGAWSAVKSSSVADSKGYYTVVLELANTTTPTDPKKNKKFNYTIVPLPVQLKRVEFSTVIVRATITTAP